MAEGEAFLGPAPYCYPASQFHHTNILRLHIERYEIRDAIPCNLGLSIEEFQSDSPHLV